MVFTNIQAEGPWSCCEPDRSQLFAMDQNVDDGSEFFGISLMEQIGGCDIVEREQSRSTASHRSMPAQRPERSSWRAGPKSVAMESTFAPADLLSGRGAKAMAVRSPGAKITLDLILCPGDVLYVAGSPGGMNQIGARGGYMGHVMLVVELPRCIRRGTREAKELSQMWPSVSAQVLWKVKTMESKREEEGFHETDHFIFVDEAGRIYIIGEEPTTHHKLYKFEEPEQVEVFQCPLALRMNFRLDIMQKVLGQMKMHEASWSWSTAVRAILMSAEVSDDLPWKGALDQIRQSWEAAPICTSVVIIFWQRYLCMVAEMSNSTISPDRAKVNPLDWIVNWMPLRGDRTLPGELLSTLRVHGWVVILHLDGRGECVVSV